MTAEDKEIIISNTLKALLLSCKRTPDYAPSYENVRKVLEPLYHYNMSLFDVTRVLLNCYLELLAESRFQAGTNRMNDVILGLLKTPIETVCQRKGFFQNANLEDEIAISDLYQGFIVYMMSAIHLSNIGWCRHVLWSEESSTSSTKVFLKRVLLKSC
jgi:hypothetical protein